MIELKVKRKNPKVFLSDDILYSNMIEGWKVDIFVSRVIGILAVDAPNKTGFKNQDQTLFADYNKKENTLTISKL